MAISLLQSAINSNAGATTVTCAWPGATTAGSLLIMAVEAQIGSGQPMTTPTGWTLVSRVTNVAGSMSIALYYIEGAATRSGTESLSFSLGSAQATMSLAEYSGIISSASLEGFASSTGSATTSSTGSLATTNANDLLIGVLGFAGGSAFTAQSSPTNSFTIEKEQQAGSFNDLALLDRVVSATGTYSTGTTVSVSTPWAGLIAAFKAFVATFSFADGVPAGDLESASAGYPTFAELTGALDAFSAGGAAAALQDGAPPGGDSLAATPVSIPVFAEGGLREQDALTIALRTLRMVDATPGYDTFLPKPPFVQFNESLAPVGGESLGGAGLPAGYSQRVPVSLVKSTTSTTQVGFGGTPNPPVCSPDDLVQHVAYEIERGYAFFADKSLPGQDIVTNQFGAPYNQGFFFQVVVNPSSFSTPLVSYLPLNLADYFSGDGDGSGRGAVSSYIGKSVMVQVSRATEDWAPTILGSSADGYHFGYYTVTRTLSQYQGTTAITTAPPLVVIPTGHSGTVPVAWPEFFGIVFGLTDWEVFQFGSVVTGGLPTGVASNGAPNPGNAWCSAWDASGGGDTITVHVPQDYGPALNHIPTQCYAFAKADPASGETGAYGKLSGQFPTSPPYPWPGNWETLSPTKPCASNPGGLDSLPWPAPASPAIKTGLFAPFKTVVDLMCGNPVPPPPISPTPSGVLLSVDTTGGLLIVAWVSGSGATGALKVAVHAGPQRFIGNSTSGWQATQTIEPDGVSECGVLYLASERAYLCYVRTVSGSTSGSILSRTSDAFGASGWSGSQAAPAGRVSAGGRGQQQAWRLLAGADNTAANILYQQCRDNRGDTWTTGTTAVSGALGPLCGGCWTENGYGLLYTRQSDNKILFVSTQNPDRWSGSGTDTTFSGRVCGLARHPSGRLAAVTQASAGGPIHVLLSNDSGLTWTQTVAIGPTPTPPPAIVCVGDVLYLVTIVSDAPQFLASSDGGVTWT